MNPGMCTFSAEFQRLYGDVTVFDSFSALHPINFRRVLPFQHPDEGADEAGLLRAEEALLADNNEATRLAVLDEYTRCGLLRETEAADLRTVIDFYDADFFELMGLLYADVGMFRCALRWYRELIRNLETDHADFSSDTESVYASTGYGLYALGLYPEAIAWSKACIGPRQAADTVAQALINHEAQLSGGLIRSVERSSNRTRYTVGSFDPEHASQSTERLKAAIKTVAPFQEVYVDWVSHETPTPEIQPASYPFKAEFDASNLLRHRMNLIFATCAQADALIEQGYRSEARRLLAEAALVEPQAGFVLERLKSLL